MFSLKKLVNPALVISDNLIDGFKILKMWVNLLLSVLLGALCLNVEAFPKYRQEIPNGNQVPNPCNQSTIWAGVGHQAKEGAGPRNPFGLDWAANDHVSSF